MQSTFRQLVTHCQSHLPWCESPVESHLKGPRMVSAPVAPNKHFHSIGWFQLNHVLAVNLEKIKNENISLNILKHHFLEIVQAKTCNIKEYHFRDEGGQSSNGTLPQTGSTHHRDPTEAKACGNQQVIWTWRLHPKPELLLMVKKSGEKNHLTCILSGIHDDPCMVYLILSYICLCFL